MSVREKQKHAWDVELLVVTEASVNHSGHAEGSSELTQLSQPHVPHGNWSRCELELGS